MKIFRGALALVVALTTFAILGKLIAVVVNVVGTLAVANFTDNAEVFANIAAAANIVGLFAALVITLWAYRSIARKRLGNVNPPTSF